MTNMAKEMLALVLLVYLPCVLSRHLQSCSSLGDRYYSPPCNSHSKFIADKNCCKKCNECGPGEGVNQYYRGDSCDIECLPCVAGKNYSKDHGEKLCKPCLNCDFQNRQLAKECTITSNTVCGRCLPGFFESKDLDNIADINCQPCQNTQYDGPECKDYFTTTTTASTTTPSTVAMATTTTMAPITTTPHPLISFSSAITHTSTSDDVTSKDTELKTTSAKKDFPTYEIPHDGESKAVTEEENQRKKYTLIYALATVGFALLVFVAVTGVIYRLKWNARISQISERNRETDISTSTITSEGGSAKEHFELIEEGDKTDDQCSNSQEAEEPQPNTSSRTPKDESEGEATQQLLPTKEFTISIPSESTDEATNADKDDFCPNCHKIKNACVCNLRNKRNSLLRRLSRSSSRYSKDSVQLLQSEIVQYDNLGADSRSNSPERPPQCSGVTTDAKQHKDQETSQDRNLDVHAGVHRTDSINRAAGPDQMQTARHQHPEPATTHKPDKSSQTNQGNKNNVLTKKILPEQRQQGDRVNEETVRRAEELLAGRKIEHLCFDCKEKLALYLDPESTHIHNWFHFGLRLGMEELDLINLNYAGAKTIAVLNKLASLNYEAKEILTALNKIERLDALNAFCEKVIERY